MMQITLEQQLKNGHYALFFCFAITLHNLEETIWLPKWSHTSYSIQQPVSSNEFIFAVIVITALAYLTAFSFVQAPKHTLAKYIFTGFLGAMIFNTFIPHLLSTIMMKAYAPGLLTGLLLLVPINTFILYQLHKRQHITVKGLFISTAIIGGMLLLLIPILFKIANRLIIY